MRKNNKTKKGSKAMIKLFSSTNCSSSKKNETVVNCKQIRIYRSKYFRK